MPAISNNNIANAIFQGSKGKTGNDLHKYSQNVVKFLAKKRFLSKSRDILERLNKIANDKEGIIEVKLRSAKRLAPETKHHLATTLKKRYRAKDVVWNEVIDEKLLGGFRVEINDEVIDLTIKNKINKLQEHLNSAHE